MPGNRRLFEQTILNDIDAITPYKENVELYRQKFASMTDAEMDKFVDDLENGRIQLAIIEPNMGGKKPYPDEAVMAVAEKHGYKFMQKLFVEGKDGLPTYKTPVEFPILLIPARRASQLLAKKVSVPPHSKVRDLLTGQVTGVSKGATVSGPEVQILAAMQADKSAVEMMKFRGGDRRGEAAYYAMLAKYGRASQSVLQSFSSGVQSKAALSTFLTAAMHRVNL